MKKMTIIKKTVRVAGMQGSDKRKIVYAVGTFLSYGLTRPNHRSTCMFNCSEWKI